MGRKKFHLVVRKNEERKKYATLTSLIVSVPTAKLPVQDLGTMLSQLKIRVVMLCLKHGLFKQQ